MKNNATRTIRSEEITIDVRICAALAAKRGSEVYLAAIAPDMELTVITLDEAPGILPCFDEDDACLNLPQHLAAALLQPGAGTEDGRQALPDRPCDSGSHQHGWRGHLADH